MASYEIPSTRQVPLLQFIIALLLVKSKPSTLSCTGFRKQLASYIKEGPRSEHSIQAGAHVDTDEEIATLRDRNVAESRRPMASHTNEGLRPERSSQTDAHIDVAAFWRNRATQLEEQNAALKVQVSQLRKKVSEIQGEETLRIQDSAGSDHSTQSQTLKRPRGGELGEDVSSRSTKRPRTVVGERDAVFPNPTFNETGFEWDELGDNLLDILHNLQRSPIARRANLLGPTDLASKLTNAATAICHHVSEIDLPANFPDITKNGLRAVTTESRQVAATYPQIIPEDIVEQRLLIIGQTLPHFLVHLHTLSQFSGTGNLCEKVICKYINIFRVLFQRVCELAVNNAKSDQDRQKTVKELNAGRKQQFAMNSSDERPDIPPTIMGLCKLSITFLSCLDPIKPVHKTVLEGCLNLLITRTGKALESFTFGGRPYGIPWDAKLMSTAASDAEACEAQAPYLIWMLDCTQRFNLSASLTSNAIDTRIRLQNTLVRAVFGEIANASYGPALEPPDFPPDEEIMTEIATHAGAADIRDWFKGEVWRLVGWEVLRGKGRVNTGSD